MSSCRAGSGAIPELQDATSAQVSGARDKFASNVQKTKRRIDGIWGQGKVGLISSAFSCERRDFYLGAWNNCHFHYSEPLGSRIHGALFRYCAGHGQRLDCNLASQG